MDWFLYDRDPRHERVIKWGDASDIPPFDKSREMKGSFTEHHWMYHRGMHVNDLFDNVNYANYVN